jgi:O-antigen ligase
VDRPKNRMPLTGPPSPDRTLRALVLAFTAAAAVPALLAYSVPPSTTALNQLLAVGLWGLVACAIVALPGSTPGGWGHEQGGPSVRAIAGAAALPLAVAVCALASWAVHPLPLSLALTTQALLLAAAVAAAAGAWTATRPDGPRAFGAFGAAWALAGLACAAVAVIQVFAPPAGESWWIARSGLPGRAVGNLRQPNHLATVLLWALAGLVAWLQARHATRDGTSLAAAGQPGLARERRVETAATLALVAALMLALVLSGSRTGLVGLALLAAWGLLDRRLAWPARLPLLAAPPLCALAWGGVSWWSVVHGTALGARQRLAEGDISASRFGIWSDTWALLQQHPWTGVGWGQFNFAWSLSPFPTRPVAFFDHTHNLPLQWAVELGVPAAAGLLALALWGLWRAWRRSRGAGAGEGAARGALMMVLVVGLHSLLEYPLWYAHFLLPAAFAWGHAQARAWARPAPPAPPPPAAGRGRPARALAGAGLLCALGAGFAVQDYLRVAQVFQTWPDAPPLAERIDEGRGSVFFAHHAHYAAATTAALPPPQRRQGFDVASRHILDTRLMIAWAREFEQAGDRERALYIAQRLREFRNPAARAFFAPCERPTAGPDGQPLPPPPFPCGQPTRALGWQDFLPERGGG